MIKNYFKTAWRNLTKNKTFSLINMAGLSIGMAACHRRKSSACPCEDRQRCIEITPAGCDGHRAAYGRGVSVPDATAKITGAGVGWIARFGSIEGAREVSRPWHHRDRI